MEVRKARKKKKFDAKIALQYKADVWKRILKEIEKENQEKK